MWLSPEHLHKLLRSSAGSKRRSPGETRQARVSKTTPADRCELRCLQSSNQQEAAAGIQEVTAKMSLRRQPFVCFSTFQPDMDVKWRLFRVHDWPIRINRLRSSLLTLTPPALCSIGFESQISVEASTMWTSLRFISYSAEFNSVVKYLCCLQSTTWPRSSVFLVQTLMRWSGSESTQRGCVLLCHLKWVTCLSDSRPAVRFATDGLYLGVVSL